MCDCKTRPHFSRSFKVNAARRSSVCSAGLDGPCSTMSRYELFGKCQPLIRHFHSPVCNRGNQNNAGPVATTRLRNRDDSLAHAVYDATRHFTNSLKPCVSMGNKIPKSHQAS